VPGVHERQRILTDLSLAHVRARRVQGRERHPELVHGGRGGGQLRDVGLDDVHQGGARGQHQLDPARRAPRPEPAPAGSRL
jgi:hypothetical protein